MSDTNLDEIVDFPREVINKICESQEIIGLLADKPTATIEDIEDNNGELKYMFDYDYIDETITEISSFICVDTIITKVGNDHIKDVKLLVWVISHKQHMKLDRTLFKGYKGNRRNNIVKYIDKLLNGSDDFGIGALQLQSVSNITLPSNFTGKQLIYTVPSFNRKGVST